MRSLKASGLLLFIMPLIIYGSAQAADSLWLQSSTYRPGGGKPGELSLYFGDFPQDDKKADTGRIWLKAPDGTIKELSPSEGDKRFYVKTQFAGLHTAEAFFEHRTSNKHRRYYAKLQFNRFGREVKEKKTDNPLMDTPLEIIPITRLRMHQRLDTRQRFALKVLYNKKPLANVPLSVITQEGWEKVFRTDEQGKVVVTFIKDRPSRPETRRTPEKYLFRVEYGPVTGKTDGICYIASYIRMYIHLPGSGRVKAWGILR